MGLYRFLQSACFLSVSLRFSPFLSVSLRFYSTTFPYWVHWTLAHFLKAIVQFCKILKPSCLIWLKRQILPDLRHFWSKLSQAVSRMQPVWHIASNAFLAQFSLTNGTWLTDRWMNRHTDGHTDRGRLNISRPGPLTRWEIIIPHSFSQSGLWWQ